MEDDQEKVQIHVEAADANEPVVRPREWLVRYYINDLLARPLFSAFLSKKKKKKEAILGSKRLSLDSIASHNGSQSFDRQKTIKIHIPDRIAKQ